MGLSPEQVYTELEKKSLGRYRFFFGRHLFVVKVSDFSAFRQCFDEVPDILNDKINFRTRNAFKHIHAIQSGSLVQLHYDFGNPRVSPFMAIPHFFIDVIPFFAYGLVTLSNPYKIGFTELAHFQTGS